MQHTLFGRPVNPITWRKWQNFKANRRGYYSLWIFLVLFFLSLFAELIANDRPLYIEYDGRAHFPVMKVYTEVDFGGEFESEAEYSDPYVRELIEEKGWILSPIVPWSFDSIDYESEENHPSTLSARHLLGTDDQGRDVLARVIYGFRISVLFGLILTLVSSVIGILVGAFQGYFGGNVDLIGQRFIEIWQGLPMLYLLIIMSAAIAPGFYTLLFLMILFSWTALVGVVRAEFLRARNFDYVRAAKALGVSDTTIMYRHVLPNAMVATITFMPFILSGGVATLTSLDFMGFGLPPGSPSLGELLNQGKNNLQAPWLGITAFLVLSVMLSLLVFIGEAVRDAFDPRKSIV